MACLRPLRAYPIGGEDKRYHVYSRIDKDLPNTITVDGELRQQIEIPCGRCEGCRMDNAKDWSTRLEMEMQQYEGGCYFVTFTYDDCHLPVNSFGAHTLDKKEFSKFLKRLRKHIGSFRFFVCGEYGDKSYRPHYHCLFFGLRLAADDLVYYKSERGYRYYNSKLLSSVWKNGFVVVTEMTRQNIRYTARYVLKKAGGRDNNYYKKLGVEPEFINMSRRPGIGANYDISKDLNTSGIQLENGEFVRIPKYNLKRYGDLQRVAKYKLLRKYACDLRSGGEESSDFLNDFKIQKFKKKALRDYTEL